MYAKSAQFYDALYHFKDYAAAARELLTLLQRTAPAARTLLDVGCGTGKHLEKLKDHYIVEGSDISAEMLAVARQRCGDITFHQNDMTQLDLGRKFDIVTCLFSAIAYVRSCDRMCMAISRMASHLNPGGVLVIEPWISPDRYRVGSVVGNYVDQPDLKIAWMYTQQLDGVISLFDINYLVATPEGVNHFTEMHQMGMFTHEQYVGAFESAGLSVSYDPQGFFGRGLYVGVSHA